jgi:hypothetical protein
VTHIVDRLRDFIPDGTPAQLLPPPLDLKLHAPQAADPKFRASLGLRESEKVVVFTGSNTFVNEPEMRELYLAIELLNERGVPTRLVRTGFNSPTFLDGIPAGVKAHVLDLGFVDKAQLPKLLALADVLVQPGHPGPFNDYRLPSKLPEFLASGRPVILPPTNLAAEMKDGREALFLKSGSPAEIADLCRKIFGDAALAASLRATGLGLRPRALRRRGQHPEGRLVLRFNSGQARHRRLVSGTRSVRDGDRHGRRPAGCGFTRPARRPPRGVCHDSAAARARPRHLARRLCANPHPEGGGAKAPPRCATNSRHSTPPISRRRSPTCAPRTPPR